MHAPATSTTSPLFHINSIKLNLTVVILSTNDNIKYLENMKQGFKRKVYWNKYRSEITTQLSKNNLDSMIDPTFRNINRLLVLSFKNSGNDEFFK